MPHHVHREIIGFYPSFNPVQVLTAKARIALNGIGLIKLVVFIYTHLMVRQQVNPFEVPVFTVGKKEFYDLVNFLPAVIDSL